METLKFEELGLLPEIERAVKTMGFEVASPIQARAIPAMRTGRDIVGQAQTGTGKTAAFGIPLLEKIDESNKRLQAIILCPTRELAIQVADEIRNLAKYMSGIKILPVYGGQDIVKQIRSLKGGVQIIVGTPGRVMDHMRRKTIRMEDVDTVILDEADEMLSMGFREDIETILKETKEERQTVLFSATLPQEILNITYNYQKDAEMIKVVNKELTVPNIEQYYYEVSMKNREEVLSRLLDIYSPKLSIIFCNTKKQVDLLVNALLGRGYFAAALHGDMKQEQREHIMQGFRDGKTEVLVATDIAARGLDIDEVEAVFNYEIPQDVEYYVHRIGRTGRAGREGKAFSFVWGREMYKVKEIERYCKTKIVLQKVPSLGDVANTKTVNLLAEVERIIKEENLKDMIDIIEDKVNISDYTAMDIAAALLKLSVGSNADEDEIEIEEPPIFKAKGNRDRDKYGETRRNDKSVPREGMVRLHINIGKNHKVMPKDILGAIANESHIPGKAIGAIDMFDKYTFVNVEKKHAKAVLRAMNKVKIKGTKVTIEKAKSR
ncbi:MAG: DEAD/DEAH box helicase [Lachnospiraceae bacterium]|nr:DEAD/DEAH box helicase [Lachnospiraceae bacterium]